jgi:hypothetical protein
MKDTSQFGRIAWRFGAIGRATVRQLANIEYHKGGDIPATRRIVSGSTLTRG